MNKTLDLIAFYVGYPIGMLFMFCILLVCLPIIWTAMLFSWLEGFRYETK